MWMMTAILSAVFAGLTAILAKCGIRKTNSDVATALRTVVVLIFSVLMVFVVGSQGTIAEVNGKSWLFLVLSGLSTACSWICYFQALSAGDVNKVAPIDKSSTVLSVLLAIILFGETNNLPVKLGCTALIGAGTYLMIEKKGAAVHRPVRSGHRRLLALLLLRHSKWRFEHCGSHRQAEHSSDCLVLADLPEGNADSKGGTGPFHDVHWHADHGAVDINGSHWKGVFLWHSFIF